MKDNLSEEQYQSFVGNPYAFFDLLLNADLGEGGQYDEAIMAYIHAANIACGGHAGTNKTMRTTIRAALNNQLIIGAHPSYVDKENFGRTSHFKEQNIMQIIDAVLNQIDTIANICVEEKTILRYVKPHGALYHDLNNHRSFAAQLASEIRSSFPNVAIMGFAGSIFLHESARCNMETWPESFVDRRYMPDGSLMPRNHPDLKAVLDLAQAVEQATHLKGGWVYDSEGNQLNIESKTLCLHGDTEQALEIAQHVFNELYSKRNKPRA